MPWIASGSVRDWLRAHALWLLGGLCVVAVAYQVVLHQVNILVWDVLLLSGLAVLTVGVSLARAVPAWFTEMVGRLVKRGALDLTTTQGAALLAVIEARAAAWAHRWGLVIALAILVAFLLAGLVGEVGERPASDRWGLAVAEAVLAYVAGRYLGRMAAYGSLGRQLGHDQTPIMVQPGHPDRAAGLKPVGDFYFRQAMLTALPGVYLAVWWVIIPHWSFRDYGYWRDPYLGLLGLVLILEVLAFVLPLWWFHRAMLDQKTHHLLPRADELSRQITAEQAELARVEVDAQRRGLEDRLAAMLKQYQAIEATPTWPVDVTLWRRFTINNLALALPLISQVFGLEGTAQRIVKGLGDVFDRLGQLS